MTEASSAAKTLRFSGYHRNKAPQPDLLLSQVCPGTPGGECRLRAGQPPGRKQRLAAFWSANRRSSFFNRRNYGCDQHHERSPNREGVVLLVSGKSEEEQREAREHGEKPR